jgi:hypothetical protein
MPEKLAIGSVQEILKPQNTPEMGFQSYVMLEGDKETREKAKSDFLANKIVNPKLDYPRLDLDKLDTGTRRLQDILSVADSIDGDTERLAVWNSAAFRIAEMYWLKTLAYLQQVIDKGDDEQVEAAAKELQWLNEQLYGVPSPKFTEAIFGEAIHQIDQKQLTDANQELYDQFRFGCVVEVTGQKIPVPAAFIATENRLPEINGASLDSIKKLLERDYPYVFDAVDEYYESVISKRDESDRAFTPDDMFNLFKSLQAVSPELNVIFDEDASRMSWDTERMAIIVGGRRQSIKSKEVMASKMIHEYGVHAIRALKGSASELPTLGTGIFTEIEDNYQSDYLTFEEGLASVCEFAIAGDKTKWDPVDLEKSAAIALAYKGLDFRQIYETLWRMRCLLQAKDGQDLKQEAIEKAKRNSYASVERVFRGTPSDLPRVNGDGTPRVLTFNKDLAYLSGKIMALDFIKSADREALELALKGKFDPINPKQLSLAQRYLK